ncbi:hypothetical protein [Agarivorans sp. 1_MG-2023]|uniref:hypothetical protein n=1 Tax=Agarivorans sp. 1_MG-2023 TaxID=3062634 RepID=UPI0026E39DC0|nr:hypothetical protein [Agarivorans sp. 1_MG-2023]MDO6763408.1 hypothetical protein [Agarivorans sp. 1_MG-2023]
MTEQEFLNTVGLEKHDILLKCQDHKGNDIRVIPDAILLGYEGVDELVFVEYKNGVKLSTDGKVKGKVAAEKKKADYLNNTFGQIPPAKRRAYAESHLGWNHSLYKFIGMKAYYDGTALSYAQLDDCEPVRVRVVVVDPKLNHHLNDRSYVQRVCKGQSAGVEFMTVSDFSSEFEGYLQQLPS